MARELLFPPLPYIAVYRVQRDAAEIARIGHKLPADRDEPARRPRLSFKTR
jgi:hypothetical protein